MGVIIREWDVALLDEFAQVVERWGNSCAYEQGALYLAQAMRRGGWVFTDEELGWLTVARNYLGPNRHAALVPLTPCIDKLLPVALCSCAGHCPFEIVKHVPEEAVCRLSSTLFRPEQPGPLSPEAFLEDVSEDRLPQVIFNVRSDRWRPVDRWTKQDCRYRHWLPEVFDGSAMADFRSQLRRFCLHTPMRGHRLEIRPLADVPLSECYEALKNWIEAAKPRLLASGRPRVRDLSACFIEPNFWLVDFVKSRGMTSPYEVGELIYVDGKPAAIWLGGLISVRFDSFGVNVITADTTYFNLARYTLYRSLLAGSRFAEWVTLGGSELESLYFFKRSHARGTMVNYRRLVDLHVISSPIEMDSNCQLMRPTNKLSGCP